MATYKTVSPVLIIAHRRVETTRRVIDAVRNAAPRQVFFFVDAARPSRSGEREQVDDVRSLFHALDWGCDVETLFPSENLGCQRGVTTAVDWFFSSVPEGIVLEDDCLPHDDLFRFCDQMLADYRNDERIVHIGGTNPLRFEYKPGTSYFFSEYFHIWGWASWRRAVRGFRELVVSGRDRPDIPDPTPAVLAYSSVRRFWTKRWSAEIDRSSDNWDSLWNLHLWTHGGLSIVPTSNLVTNIGYGHQGTHATKFPLIAGNPPAAKEMTFPLLGPKSVEPDQLADTYVTRAVYGVMPWGLRPVFAALELVRRIVRPSYKKNDPTVNRLTVAQVFWSRWLGLRPPKPRFASHLAINKSRNLGTDGGAP